jgi:tryptophan 6-halogenase
MSSFSAAERRAGWLPHISARHFRGTLEVTVLEAPAIPRIGVGEATVPNLQRVVFDFLGIAEENWMRECNASFKMAVKFINWRTADAGQATARSWNGRPDHFYHPFGLLPTVADVPLSHYWARKRLDGETDEPFDYACFHAPALMDAVKAPKDADGRSVTHHAWHFDAQLVADYPYAPGRR